MIRKNLFLTSIFHTLALGGGFSESCTHLEIRQGSTVLRAKCNNFQNIKIETDVDLHNCIPCYSKQSPVPCGWYACSFTVPPEKPRDPAQVTCHDDHNPSDYQMRDLGELLLFRGLRPDC
jgi:hypothetical protein